MLGHQRRHPDLLQLLRLAAPTVLSASLGHSAECTCFTDGSDLQVVRDHHLGLQCICDAHSLESAAGNGAACPQEEPFTTWKFRSDGVSKRTIDFIW